MSSLISDFCCVKYFPAGISLVLPCDSHFSDRTSTSKSSSSDSLAASIISFWIFHKMIHSITVRERWGPEKIIITRTSAELCSVENCPVRELTELAFFPEYRQPNLCDVQLVSRHQQGPLWKGLKISTSVIFLSTTPIADMNCTVQFATHAFQTSTFHDLYVEG